MLHFFLMNQFMFLWRYTVPLMIFHSGVLGKHAGDIKGYKTTANAKKLSESRNKYGYEEA